MTAQKNAPITGPQVAQLFSQAFDLIGELEAAASADGRGFNFGLEFLSDEEFEDFNTRLGRVIGVTTGNEPLELQVLDRALYMIENLLVNDECLRDEFSAYREFCTEARARKLKKQQENTNG